MENRRRIVVIAVLIMLVGGSVAAYAYFRPDSQLAEIRDLRDQLNDMPRDDANRDQRRALYRQIDDLEDQLSDDQRSTLRREREERMGQFFEERMDEFFAKAPEERIEALDEILDREQEMQKRMEQWRRQREAQGNNGGDRGGDNQRGDGNRRWRGRGPRDNSPQARNERRRSFLDHTSPERRAKWTEFRRQLNDRRKERGLPEVTWGWGRRGRRS